MNRKLLMAFVLVSGMALAQTSGGSAGSTSTDQNPQGTQTQTQPSTPSQQPASPSDQWPGNSGARLPEAIRWQLDRLPEWAGYHPQRRQLYAEAS